MIKCGRAPGCSCMTFIAVFFKVQMIVVVRFLMAFGAIFLFRRFYQFVVERRGGLPAFCIMTTDACC